MEQLQLLNMATFAQININNIVIRVNKGCNIDVANNGGDMSEQAAENFKKTSPLSSEGVRWVQTSYNGSFRKNPAAVGSTYDPQRDAFIAFKIFNSWVLNENTCKWEAPVQQPLTYNDYAQDNTYVDSQNNPLPDRYFWNESKLNWQKF
jgi:hypothetical protein